MKDNFNYFLNPGSVAIIGASTRTGPDSFNILEVMIAKGYSGDVYPVNPKAAEILGIKAYPSILDIPGEVDLAIISTGRMVVPDLVRQCVEKPVKGIIIITQGFADADDTGREMQDRIINMISGTDIRVIGPNTLGVVNNFDNFISAFVDVPTKFLPVGVICQSGMFVGAHVDIFGGAGFGVDIGNAADLGFSEVMEFYSREDRIGVINLHMEGIRGGRQFFELSREVVRKKPVIVYKTGRTKEGAHAASSHSGSLAGEDHVYGAAFKQVGIIRANSLDDLRDFNKTFTTYKNTPGNRVAVVTFTGGGGIAVLDALGEGGLVPAKLSPRTEMEIQEIFPDWLKASNPVDLWPSVMMHGYEKVYTTILDLVISDPGVDMVACIAGTHYMPEEGSPYVEKYILEAARKHVEKPVAIWMFGSARNRMTAHVEGLGPVAVYSSPERLARALGVLYRYYQQTLKVDVQGDLRRFTSAVPGPGSGRGPALGREAMELLNTAGIPTARGRLARNPEEALEIAGEIGYPVALKVVSPQVIHKTEAGGISLDIRDRDSLVNAFQAMTAGVERLVPGVEVEGVLVQEYLGEGTELILGSKRDKEFGPVVVYGLGGIYTEILRDVTFRIAPVTVPEALEMVRETKSYGLLQGARGKAKADLRALAQAIVELSEFVAKHPEISEIDINPLLATPKGVVALDARVIF